MKIQIIMKNDVYDTVMTLMKNIKTLNDGNEIGGWLTGDWKHTKKSNKLILDEFIIPEQEVTGTEVDMSPESMTSLVKLMGNGNTNRIKAHWHIHPFGLGDTSWSPIDEEKIRNFMQPDKGREIFVFLLSSLDQIKARVVINLKASTRFLEDDIIVTKDFDDIEVQREVPIKRDNSIYNKLEKVIKKRVNVRKPESDDENTLKYYLGEERAEQYKKEKQKDSSRISFYNQYEVTGGKNKVVLQIYPELYIYMKNNLGTSYEMQNYSKIISGKRAVTLIYNIDKKNEHLIEDIKSILEEEMIYASAEYERAYNVKMLDLQ